MKKRLLSVAIMLLTILGFAMQATAQTPTLTPKWKIAAGLPAAGNARQMILRDGKIYIQDRTAQKIEIWDQTGKTGEIASSGAGTNISVDQAGNIITRVTAFPGVFADGNVFRIFPADGGEPVDMTLSGLPAGRADFFGDAQGNVLDPDEGGRLFLTAGTVKSVTVVKIVGGVQDVDYTVPYPLTTVSPDVTTMVQVLNDTEAVITQRSTGNPPITKLVFDFDAETMDDSYQYNTPNRYSSSSSFVFTMGGVDYIIYNTSATNAYKDGFAIAKATNAAENEIIVEHLEDPASVPNGYQTNWVKAEVVSATKANIYQYFPGGFIAMYEFEVPAAEKPLYMIGQIEPNNYAWGANVGHKMTMVEDGVYTTSVKIAESATVNGTPAFGFATKLGADANDWGTLNSNRYGTTVDGTVAEEGKDIPFVKADGAFKTEGWTYDVTVDMNKMTFKIVANPPIPVPDPDQLYIIGEVEGAEAWTPNSGVKLEKQADGTYTGQIQFNGAGTWGIVENLGATPEDWDTPNAKRYGPAVDKEIVTKGVASTIMKSQNAFMILVDKYDVVVDLKANTVTCTQVVTPADRAIYAYGLKAVADETNYTLSYTLNSAATDVTIKVSDDQGAQVGEIINAPVSAGTHSVTIAKASYPGENLSWEVSAQGTPVDAFTRITPLTMDFAAWAPYGVDVDKNPESKNFGNVYVTNAGAGACNKPDGKVDCIQGLYVYTPDLKRLSVDGKKTFTGGITFETFNSFCEPRSVKVAADGSLFVGLNTLANNPLYKVDLANYDSWTPVFEGTQDDKGVMTNSKGEFVAGGTIAMSFVGEGADQKLFVLGSKNRATSYSINDMFMSVYNIGYKTTWDQAPSTTLDAPQNFTNTQANTIVADAEGGYWVAQHRAANNVAEPTLMHFAADGTRNYARYSADTEIPNFCAGGGLAFNKEGSLMAVSNSGAGAPTKGSIALYSVTYDAQNVPTVTFVESFMTELGTNINEMAFDYAGNIHVVSNSGEWYMAYSCKKANNMETVKCNTANMLNAKRVTNAPTNLAGLQQVETNTVKLTWDAPAEGETPLYYTVSITSGEYVKVYDGITETEFLNDLSWVTQSMSFTYIVSAVYANNIVMPSTEVVVAFNPFSSVEDINGANNVSKVYPNPTTGILNIESTNGIYNIEIYNANSQLVNQINVDGSAATQCDITDQPSGIYFVKVNGNAIVKVIKK